MESTIRNPFMFLSTTKEDLKAGKDTNSCIQYSKLLSNLWPETTVMALQNRMATYYKEISTLQELEVHYGHFSLL